MKTNKEILDSLVSKETSGWKREADFRKANRKWLDKSAKIALKILKSLKLKNMTQAELAEAMQVTPQQISKIVKGRENLTLKTISKIEEILEVVLIEVSFNEESFKYTNTENIKQEEIQNVVSLPVINKGYDEFSIASSSDYKSVYSLGA